MLFGLVVKTKKKTIHNQPSFICELIFQFFYIFFLIFSPHVPLIISKTYKLNIKQIYNKINRFVYSARVNRFLLKKYAFFGYLHFPFYENFLFDLKKTRE